LKNAASLLDDADPIKLNANEALDTLIRSHYSSEACSDIFISFEMFLFTSKFIHADLLILLTSFYQTVSLEALQEGWI
jgi:hypothetical protein